MKKNRLFWLLIILMFPTVVLAVGNVNVDTDDIYLIKGESKTLDITSNNSAGRINIQSSNPLVVSVSDESVFLDNESKTITLEGIEKGTSVISVYTYDVSTYDEEDLSDNEYNINVYVYIKGDITNDDTVDLQDVISLLRMYLTNSTTRKDITIGDMDNNNIIGINDIVLLLRMYLNN